MTVETEETRTKDTDHRGPNLGELSCGLEEGTLGQKAPESPGEHENEQVGRVHTLGLVYRKQGEHNHMLSFQYLRGEGRRKNSRPGTI